MDEHKKEELGNILAIDEKRQRVLDLQKEMQEPNFWQDHEKAGNLSKELADLQNMIAKYESANTSEEIEELEKMALFSGVYDKSDAIISFHAGAGGTEAQDWAQMLKSMYERWAQKHGYSVIEIDQSKGEEAGIKSATLEIKEPWGTLASSLQGSNYFHDFKKNRFEFSTEMSLRLFKGLNFNINGSYERVRDQLSLIKGDSALEDVLLRIRELSTNYEYRFSIGLSYTFGSIFSNVVNPRFGSGGGRVSIHIGN